MEENRKIEDLCLTRTSLTNDMGQTVPSRQENLLLAKPSKANAAAHLFSALHQASTGYLMQVGSPDLAVGIVAPRKKPYRYRAIRLLQREQPSSLHRRGCRTTDELQMRSQSPATARDADEVKNRER